MADQSKRRPRGRRSALIIIDVQNDFCPPSGSLAVPDGTAVIPVINELREKVRWDAIVLTKDWHSADHMSFASNNPGTDVFTPLTLPNGQVQMMWPDHCVQGSSGSELHKDLLTSPSDITVYKGTNSKVDSYSGFYDNDRGSKTEMTKVLRDHNITDVYVTGLAYDYCVGFSALDAKGEGFTTFLVDDASRGVAPESTETMKTRLEKNGVTLIHSSNLTNPRTDKRSEAVDYMEKHSIMPLFEKLCSALVYDRPDDPKKFLVEKLKQLQKKKGDISSLSLFNDQDLDTMFDLLDPIGRGKLTSNQVNQALKNLGVAEGTVEIVNDVTYSRDEFKSTVKKGLSL